jgi:hypothetical protein
MEFTKIDNSFKKPYFCPLCMTLFLESKNYSFDEKRKNFECKICKKEFDEKDFSNEIRRKGKNYKVSNKRENDVNTEINKIILDLWKQDLSNRQIQNLTKFSRTRIQKETALWKKEKMINVSEREFCTKYLKIKYSNYLELKKEKIEITDILIDAIRKALLFGCSGRQVSKLFNVSHRVIKKAKTIQYQIIKDSEYQKLVGEEAEKELDRLNEKIKDYEDSLDTQTMKENGITYKQNKVTFKEDLIEIVLVTE